MLFLILWIALTWVLCLNTQEGEAAAEEEKKKSRHLLKKIEKRQEGHKLDTHLEEQFASGRLMAAIASRPGQCGRADGYVDMFFGIKWDACLGIFLVLKLCWFDVYQVHPWGSGAWVLHEKDSEKEGQGCSCCLNQQFWLLEVLNDVNESVRKFSIGLSNFKGDL